MKRLNIGFDFLLIFFNLFAYHNSYIMASEKRDQPTTSEKEVFSGWDFDERDFLPKPTKNCDKLDGRNSDANSGQEMVNDSNKEQLSKLKKKPSVDCPENTNEQADSLFSRLAKNKWVKKFLPEKRKPSQESLELSPSSFSDRNSEE